LNGNVVLSFADIESHNIASSQVEDLLGHPGRH
jgi:hypothetical protein